MADRVQLVAEPRPETGKGGSGRLRRRGRTPAVVYGYQADPTPVHVDALDLYHVLHTEAGANVLIELQLDGGTNLCVARDVQRHPVRGDVIHLDLLAVDPRQQILVEVPVHVVGEDEVEAPGVLSHVLHSVPINVEPTKVPNAFDIDVAGMAIGDVRRVEDLSGQLPEGATFEIDTDRAVATVNPPDVVETAEDEELEDAIEGAIPEGAEDASEVPATDEGGQG